MFRTVMRPKYREFGPVDPELKFSCRPLRPRHASRISPTSRVAFHRSVRRGAMRLLPSITSFWSAPQAYLFRDSAVVGIIDRTRYNTSIWTKHTSKRVNGGEGGDQLYIHVSGA